MILDEVKDRLVAQGVGVYGKNIFLGSGAVIPDGDGPYLSLRETGGTSSIKTQNDTGNERPSVHVLARGKNPVQARTMCKNAHTALGGANGLFNIILSGTLYVRLVAAQSITDIGMDAAGRTMYSFNVETEKHPS